MRPVNKIIIHCDANDNPRWGLKELKIEHVNVRNFKMIGYHYWIDFEGIVYGTRPEEVIGAHTVGENSYSVGIALHGNHEFKDLQFKSLKNLLVDLCKKYKLNKDDIYPHHNFNRGKTCPNFDLEIIKDEVGAKLKGISNESKN